MSGSPHGVRGPDPFEAGVDAFEAGRDAFEAANCPAAATVTDEAHAMAVKAERPTKPTVARNRRVMQYLRTRETANAVTIQPRAPPLISQQSWLPVSSWRALRA